MSGRISFNRKIRGVKSYGCRYTDGVYDRQLIASGCFGEFIFNRMGIPDMI